MVRLIGGGFGCHRRHSYTTNSNNILSNSIFLIFCFDSFVEGKIPYTDKLP